MLLSFEIIRTVQTSSMSKASGNLTSHDFSELCTKTQTPPPRLVRDFEYISYSGKQNSDVSSEGDNQVSVKIIILGKTFEITSVKDANLFKMLRQFAYKHFTELTKTLG